MGKEYEGWSSDVFMAQASMRYTPLLFTFQWLELSHIAHPAVREPEKSCPTVIAGRRGIGFVNTQHSLPPCSLYYSPLRRIYLFIKVKIKFHFLWKASFNQSDGSENSLFWSFTIPIIFVTYFTLATYNIAKLLFFLIVYVLSSPV